MAGKAGTGEGDRAPREATGHNLTGSESGQLPRALATRLKQDVTFDWDSVSETEEEEDEKGPDRLRRQKVARSGSAAKAREELDGAGAGPLSHKDGHSTTYTFVGSSLLVKPAGNAHQKVVRDAEEPAKVRLEKLLVDTLGPFSASLNEGATQFWATVDVLVPDTLLQEWRHVQEKQRAESSDRGRTTPSDPSDISLQTTLVVEQSATFLLFRTARVVVMFSLFGAAISLTCVTSVLGSDVGISQPGALLDILIHSVAVICYVAFVVTFRNGLVPLEVSPVVPLALCTVLQGFVAPAAGLANLAISGSLVSGSHSTSATYLVTITLVTISLVSQFAPLQSLAPSLRTHLSATSSALSAHSATSRTRHQQLVSAHADVMTIVESLEAAATRSAAVATRSAAGSAGFEHLAMHFATARSATEALREGVKTLFEDADADRPRGPFDGGEGREQVPARIFDVTSLIEAVADSAVGMAWKRGVEMVVSCQDVEGKGAKHINMVQGSIGTVAALTHKLLDSVLKHSRRGSSLLLSLSVSPPHLLAPSTTSPQPSLTSVASFVADIELETRFVRDTSDPSFRPASILDDPTGSMLVARLDAQTTFFSHAEEENRDGRAATDCYRVAFVLPVVQASLPPPMAPTRGPSLPKPNVEDVVGYGAALAGLKVAIIGAVAKNDVQRGGGAKWDLVENLRRWIEGWGCAVTTSASTTPSQIPSFLDRFDASHCLRSSRRPPARRSPALSIVDNEYDLLDAVVTHRAETGLSANVLFLCQCGTESRAAEFVQSITSTTAFPNPALAPRVLIIAKPVGPRKLLSAIRYVVADLDLDDHLGSDEDEEDGVGAAVARGGHNGTISSVPSSSERVSVATRTKSRTKSDDLSEDVAGRKRFRGGKKKQGEKDSNQVGLSQVRPPVNVLIVEDNTINQTILATFLKKRGISCAVASNGAEAVERWSGAKYHLVLMDILMPIMDGIEATRTIRSIERQRRDERVSQGGFTGYHAADVVIVALTASTSPTDRDRALAAGCNDYLTKPVSLVWLEKKIIEWGSMQALIDFAAHEPPQLSWDSSTFFEEYTHAAAGVNGTGSAGEGALVVRMAK